MSQKANQCSKPKEGEILKDPIGGWAEDDIAVLKDLIVVSRAKFPDVQDWCAQYKDVSTALVDIKDYKTLGLTKNDIPKCQFRNLGYGKICERDTDLILLTATFRRDANNQPIIAGGVRLRYYCSPCLYTIFCRAIESISSPERLEGVIEDGATELVSYMLTEKTQWIERQIERSGALLNSKYPNSSEIIAKCREEFITMK